MLKAPSSTRIHLLECNCNRQSGKARREQGTVKLKDISFSMAKPFKENLEERGSHLESGNLELLMRIADKARWHMFADTVGTALR